MKKKLKLEVEQLRVESFSAGAEGGVRGTVRALETATCPPSTQDTTRVGLCFCTDCESCRCQWW